MSLKVTQQNGISVYTISGSNTGRSLPDWLARKRKRSLKNDEAYMNRIELIQDFEFEEASQCIKVSEDGEYAMATGTYKPQQHIYHLPSSALKYARHTSSLNIKFILLSTDYTKSLHLQTDRSLEFHTAMGCHHTTRIPRYGRDLAYLKPFAHVIVPAEGKEVFRLDLEGGRFLKPFELGGYDDIDATVNSVECVGVADGSHGLMAFGTDLGTTEFWDPRSRNRIGVLSPPPKTSIYNNVLGEAATPGVTAVEFASNGLTLATGNAAGIVTLYDLRSPTPLLSKDQGYGFPIQNLAFLHSSTNRASGLENAYESTSTPKVLSSCKRIIKIWDATNGKPWTSIEPSVDLNDVCVVPNSGMILTANEGREMHSFLIPALGPSPWWCAHLDTQIEQLADRFINDPDAYVTGAAPNETVTYDNYKFLTKAELTNLNLDHLLGGNTQKGGSLIRPYMHGYFIDQRLYDEARLIADPFEWERERTRMVKDKIDKERESRIRSTGKGPKVKINKRLAERLATLEQKLERTRKREGAGSDDEEAADQEAAAAPRDEKKVLKDDRFNKLFQNPDFEVDENTLEFQQLNPSTKPRGRTAAEEEDDSDAAAPRPKGLNLDSDSSSSESDSEPDSDDGKQHNQKSARSKKAHQKKAAKAEPEMRISTSSYKKSGHDTRGYPSSGVQKRLNKERSFGARAASGEGAGGRVKRGGPAQIMGDREISFFASGSKRGGAEGGRGGRGGRGGGRGGRGGRGGASGGRDPKERRSASGNAFRRDGVAK
ncbi:WD40 repeat-like protein [Morchella conica CCBAS932]|uniref:WD40 repeat-like protein n=1 Tax=Morchella conica CCBAS932 TaxID=1392247 RepID=A0A3N4KFW6_9PEZI|nr:WD40 repeat-like protein [Morchella conica CCBAS932]